eukprot:NODE_205_length_14851_cov_0.317584.p3 type:complete len:428 gc:universal NODE_205_length_14851_cov_0.317584:9147-10430(+)
MRSAVLLIILCMVLLNKNVQISPKVSKNLANEFKVVNILNLKTLGNITVSHMEVVFESQDAYNPAVLELPFGSRYRFLMIGRKPSNKIRRVNDKEYKYSEPVYCYGNFVKHRLECESSESKVSVAPDWNAIDNRMRMGIGDASSKYDFQDPRLWYGKINNKTEILVSFTCASSWNHQIRTTCTGYAHSVIPDLHRIITNGTAGLSKEQELININLKGSKDQYIKNVSPISYDSQLFIYKMRPLQIIKHDFINRIDELFINLPTPACLDIQNDDIDVHLASNALHIGLCEHPCFPKIEQTRIVFMIHFKLVNIGLNYPLYKRVLLFMDPKTYKVDRISPLIELEGISKSELVFDLNMNYSPESGNWSTSNANYTGMVSGYLNTPIILTLGIDLQRKSRLAYFTAKDMYTQSMKCTKEVANIIKNKKFI